MASATSFQELLAGFDETELEAILGDPQSFAEACLLVPDTEEPFRANHIQRRIFASTAQRTAIRVHRRGGKSYSLSILALYHILTRPYCRLLLICPYGSQVKEIFTVIRSFIQANPWIGSFVTVDRESPQQRLEFANGSRIVGFTTGASSKKKGAGIRGQGADVLLLDEAAYFDPGDWESVTPIIEGDLHHAPPDVYMASTPAFHRGYYYEVFSDPEGIGAEWNPIHVPITENPDVPPEKVAQIRKGTDSATYEKEWLAVFPSIGDGVFPEHLRNSPRIRVDYPPYAEALLLSEQIRREGGRPPSRAMGVDWDKQCAGSTITILEARPNGKIRQVYCEEVPQGEFTLTEAVKRVIQLNELWEPEKIFVDKGFGDYQQEELLKHAQRHPNSGLAERLEFWQFANTVDTVLPLGGIEKKPFKQAMISLLVKWMEDQKLELPLKAQDPKLDKELQEFHVVRQTEKGLIYSNEGDHRISALGLAAMAFHLRIQDPYAPAPATHSYHVPIPEAVPSALLYEDHAERLTVGKLGYDPYNRAEAAHPLTFNRRQLGQVGSIRRKSF